MKAFTDWFEALLFPGILAASLCDTLLFCRCVVTLRLWLI